MKKFFLLLCILLMCGCEETTDNVTSRFFHCDGIFGSYDKARKIYCWVMLDRETQVQYLSVKRTSLRVGFGTTALIDADGKPILFGDTRYSTGDSDRFFIYEPFGSSVNWTIVDRETLVQYLVVERPRSDGFGVTALIDPEGKPILYSAALP